MQQFYNCFSVRKEVPTHFCHAVREYKIAATSMATMKAAVGRSGHCGRCFHIHGGKVLVVASLVTALLAVSSIFASAFSFVARPLPPFARQRRRHSSFSLKWTTDTSVAASNGVKRIHPFLVPHCTTGVAQRLSFAVSESVNEESEEGNSLDGASVVNVQEIDENAPFDSLTSEQLSHRFRDVLAYYFPPSSDTAVAVASSPTLHNLESSPNHNLSLSQVQGNLLRTRHDNLHLSRCRVDTSTIPNAGLGVFATRNIQNGELITLYPGDAVILWKSEMDVEDRYGLQILFGPHITSQEREQINQDPNPDSNSTSTSTSAFFSRGADYARLYEVRLPNTTFSVIGDPQRIHDAAYLGHMVNDCACYESNGSSSGSNDDAEALQKAYQVQSHRGANAQIKIGELKCHVELVSTRDIAAGDEIFISYGVDYWQTRQAVYSLSSSSLSSQQAASREAKEPSPSLLNKSLGFSASRADAPSKAKRRKSGK